jgi:hypothetical protein
VAGKSCNLSTEGEYLSSRHLSPKVRSFIGYATPLHANALFRFRV